MFRFKGNLMENALRRKSVQLKESYKKNAFVGSFLNFVNLTFFFNITEEVCSEK